MPHAIVRAFSVAALLSAAGCASTTPPPAAQPLPSAELFAGYGNMALVGGDSGEVVAPPTPLKATAENVMGVGLAHTAYGALQGFQCGIGFILCVPAGAIIGAAVGTAENTRLRPVETVDRAAAAMALVFDANKFRDSLLDAAERYAAERTGRTLYRNASVASPALPAVAGPVAASRGSKAKKTPVINTVLTLGVRRMALVQTDRDRINPSLRLALAVEGQIRRAEDGSPLYARQWTHIGTSRDFFALAEGDAAALRAELENAKERLASQIVADLFEAPIVANAASPPMPVPDGGAPRISVARAASSPAPPSLLGERLPGAEWRGTVAGARLGEADFAGSGYSTIIRFKDGGKIEIVGQGWPTSGAPGGAGTRQISDTGEWVISEGRVCVALTRITRGQQTCYSATFDDAGRIMLQGEGLLGGKQFGR